MDSSSHRQDYRATPPATGPADDPDTDVGQQPSSLAQRTVQWRVLQQDLAAGERVTLPMLSGSMTPLMPAGCDIEVQGLADDALLEAGDIVVFREQSRLVAHRLLFGCPLPAPGWFLQRGDGVSQARVISRRDICGLVVGVTVGAAARHDLTTPAARHQGRRRARRSLLRLLRGWLLPTRFSGE